MREKVVLVLDAEQRFLSYTHPAIARRLLKEGRATVYSREPFVIQINKFTNILVNTGETK
jgi:hypothetical protein